MGTEFTYFQGVVREALTLKSEKNNTYYKETHASNLGINKISARYS